MNIYMNIIYIYIYIYIYLYIYIYIYIYIYEHTVYESGVEGSDVSGCNPKSTDVLIAPFHDT